MNRRWTFLLRTCALAMRRHATSPQRSTQNTRKNQADSIIPYNSSRFHALVSGPNVVHTFKVAKRETKHGTFWKLPHSSVHLSYSLLQIHVFHCNSEMKCPVKSCYTRNPGSSIENLILHILQTSPRTHQAQLCTKLVALQSARTLRKSACMQWKSMESAPFQPQQAELHYTACLLLTFVPFFASANRQRFVESSFVRKLAKWPRCAVPLISAPLQTASLRA